VSIGGVDGLLPVTGFQLDLDFDGAVLTALSTASGGFLPEPVIPVQDSIAPDRVEFAEVTLSGLGGTGDGVLLRVTFEAQALGTSSLTLGELILAGAFGVPIQPESVSGARITVTDRKDGEPPIPEPGAALVFGAGLTLAAWRLRGRPEPPRSSTASHPFRV
jgi:hypothetical protein